MYIEVYEYTAKEDNSLQKYLYLLTLHFEKGYVLLEGHSNKNILLPLPKGAYSDRKDFAHWEAFS